MKYEDFVKKCKDPRIICELFEANSTINPLTSRKITPKGQVYKNLSKLCEIIRNNNSQINDTFQPDRLSYMKRVKIALRSLNLDRNNYCIAQEDSDLRQFLENVELLSIGGFGRVYKISYKGLKFVLKEILLEDEDRAILKEKDCDNLLWDQWKKIYPLEIYISKLTDQLIETNQSPHFIYSAGGGLCSNCILSTLNYKEKKGSCYIAAMELADFTLTDVLDDLSDEDIKIAIQQLLLGLSVLHAKYGIVHGDLKSDNILIIRIESGGYIKYNLFGRNFYVKNNGLLFVIADFNISKIYNGKYALTKFRGNKYAEAVLTNELPGWGSAAGNEIILRPFSTRKFLSLSNKSRKIESIDNRFIRTWFNRDGASVGTYTINRFAIGIEVGSEIIIDFNDTRRFYEFTFSYDIQDILSMFNGGPAFSQSNRHKGRKTPITILNDVILNHKNSKELYNLSAAKYFFPDIMVAYLFPECQDYKPFIREYVYKHN